jgi:putative DNA methylase
MKQTKKLIEVALPLVAINRAARDEKAVPRPGHPQTMHYWWARRPLAAARAVIFAQMVDDPSAHPDIFPTEKKQEKERQRLFRIMEDLVLWENTTNEEVLERARAEIWQSWRAACAENVSHPRAKEIFNRHKLPGFHDPFAGGGALPLEAQRLGLEAFASDLNPVAVLINKAMIEFPPKFAGRPPANPSWHEKSKEEKAANTWHGTQGLAEDVRYYGQWMKDEATKRVGHLYPNIEITKETAKARPDLKPLVGQKLTVIAWLWARTVKSPNPAFAKVDVPLASTFMLSVREGNGAYVEPIVGEAGYRFAVHVGEPKDVKATDEGTKLSRGANFRCVMSGTPISPEYVKAEGRAGRMGARLVAVVAESDRGRLYLSPTDEVEAVAQKAKPTWRPETSLPDDPRNFWTPSYGLTKIGDLFTNRQLVVLTAFSDLVHEARDRVKRDAVAAGLADDGNALDAGGVGATAYAEAVSVYLGCALSRLASYNNTICHWNMRGGSVAQIFSRQSVPMSWDFIEISPLQKMSGNWMGGVEWVSDVFENLANSLALGFARQVDASKQVLSADRVVSTDPPYYDNISYADLSDFFYVWLHRSLKLVFPDLFATLVVPKVEELVASPYRHGSKENAEAFFLSGMTQAMRCLAEQAHPAFPITIYYAYKQAESGGVDGTTNTGWETFLDAVIHSGLAISGTWPMRTEKQGRMIEYATNALASSIVLVCRPRPADAPIATRRDFLSALKAELPPALAHLQRSNIAPVDLAQAALGPGMAIYTHYTKVVDAEGKTLSVHDALLLINQTLDEVLAAQEHDFDADTRWALVWFDQSGFASGDYGVAEQLSKSKNTSVAGLVDAGVLAAKAGKVRLLKPAELPEEWDPTTDKRLTVWEMVHHLIRALEAGGESAAATLIAKMGSRAEVVRELAYRLFTLCKDRKRPTEALSYNALVQSWPEITRLAREGSKPVKGQTTMFEEK